MLEKTKRATKKRQSRDTSNIGLIGLRQIHQQNTTHKAKEMNNPVPTKNMRLTHVLAKGKQFLLLIRHPPFYSYIYLSPVKVLSVINERTNLRKKEKII